VLPKNGRLDHFVPSFNASSAPIYRTCSMLCCLVRCLFHLRRVDHIRGILPVSVKQLLVSAVVAVFTVHPQLDRTDRATSRKQCWSWCWYIFLSKLNLPLQWDLYVLKCRYSLALSFDAQLTPPETTRQSCFVASASAVRLWNDFTTTPDCRRRKIWSLNILGNIEDRLTRIPIVYKTG